MSTINVATYNGTINNLTVNGTLVQAGRTFIQYNANSTQSLSASALNIPIQFATAITTQNAGDIIISNSNSRWTNTSGGTKIFMITGFVNITNNDTVTSRFNVAIRVNGGGTANANNSSYVPASSSIQFTTTCPIILNNNEYVEVQAGNFSAAASGNISGSITLCQI